MSQHTTSREDAERSYRKGRTFTTIGQVTFFFGVAMAALGAWLHTQQLETDEIDQTGMILLIIAVILLLDGVVFTVIGRKIMQQAEKNSSNETF